MRAFGIDTADRRLEQNLLARLRRAKLHEELAARLLASGIARQRDGVAHDVIADDGTARDGLEVLAMVVLPPVVPAVSPYGVAPHLHLHVQRGLVLNAIVEVENEACAVRLGESPAVQGGAAGGSQFGTNAIALQANGVISRPCHFFVVAIGRGKRHSLRGILLPHIAHILLADGGHDEEIAEVGTARSAQARVGETVDAIVGVMIARAGIPIVNARVGAGLYHAVRHHGSGVGVPMTAGSDEGVYILHSLSI